MSQQRVLVVDDEANTRRVLEIMLQKMGLATRVASNGQEALALAQRESFDLILTDLRMPGMDGLALLDALRAQKIETPVILLTAYGTVESAVHAMKSGAYDYILRPFDVEAVERTITRALTTERTRRENLFLREEIEKGWGEFVGRSAAMQQVYDLIHQVAPSNTNVLITGETGTGKELAARAIHRASPRKKALFVPINCAAIPDDILESELFGHTRGSFTGASHDRVGKFEMAHGGTIFLDEITEMPLPMQAKLLRVLQEREIERLGSNRRVPVDIRVVVATNRNPQQAVHDGTLREDLFYRINVFTVEMPPVRARIEDIPLLVQHFLAHHGTKLGYEHLHISEQALQSLQRYAWPGNVRELENVLERAAVLSRGQLIDTMHLPQELVAPVAPVASPARPSVAERSALPESLSLTQAIEQLERAFIVRALTQTDGNKAKAARVLDLSERTLWYKVKKYGIA
ncbi:MAG: sigma-54-dependent Fis family transcriptional regulator [Deltaproteobacteria bacterium]|nr:sigma-54-dependent Fis family transcriptional regulator [Deltaproteobacteria bacterium]